MARKIIIPSFKGDQDLPNLHSLTCLLFTKRYVAHAAPQKGHEYMTVRTSDDHNYTKLNTKQSSEVYYNIIITTVM